MEKASKILTILFFLGLAYIAYSAFWSKLDTYFPEEPIPLEKTVHQKPEFVDESVFGASMEPTLKSGDPIRYSTKQSVKVGDVIVFNCYSEKCLKELEYSKEPGPYRMVKRVSSVDNSCYTVLGDNLPKSLDSRYFGDLCGSDIEILGVVVSPDTKN